MPLDRLSDVLWGDAPPTTARPTLQTHLSKLRHLVQEVPGATLEHRPPGYVLQAEPTSIDADRFEGLLREGRALAADDPAAAADRLERALGCWRGAALAEFAAEPWAQAEAVRLEELRLVVTEERVELVLAAGHHGQLVPEIEALVAANPLRERLRGQLMIALHRSGRQAEALRSAQDLRRHLGEQLGLEPSPGLQQLEQAIALDDPSLRAAFPPAGPVPLSTSTVDGARGANGAGVAGGAGGAAGRLPGATRPPSPMRPRASWDGPTTSIGSAPHWPPPVC